MNNELIKRIDERMLLTENLADFKALRDCRAEIERLRSFRLRILK